MSHGGHHIVRRGAPMTNPRLLPIGSSDASPGTRRSTPSLSRSATAPGSRRTVEGYGRMLWPFYTRGRIRCNRLGHNERVPERCDGPIPTSRWTQIARGRSRCSARPERPLRQSQRKRALARASFAFLLRELRESIHLSDHNLLVVELSRRARRCPRARGLGSIRAARSGRSTARVRHPGKDALMPPIAVPSCRYASKFRRSAFTRI